MLNPSFRLMDYQAQRIPIGVNYHDANHVGLLPLLLAYTILDFRFWILDFGLRNT
jgi:hypothetical protein